jgi:hypothetical protein
MTQNDVSLYMRFYIFRGTTGAPEDPSKGHPWESGMSGPGTLLPYLSLRCPCFFFLLRTPFRTVYRLNRSSGWVP